MRITSNGMAERILLELQDNLKAVAESEQQISTGLRVNKPSDDPVSAGELVQLRSKIDRQNQYMRNIETGLSQLKMTEAELGSVNDILIQTRAIAVQGANDSLDDADRETLAEQVDQTLQELIRIANQKYGNRYLFGGNDSTESPYESEETTQGWIHQVTSNIDDEDEEFELYFDEEKKVEVALNGEHVFDLGSNGDTFSVLIDLREALAANDPVAVGDQLKNIDEAIDKANNAIALIGARISSSEAMLDRMEERELQLVTRQSDLGDADLAEALTQLNNDKLVYELGLKTASSVLKTSLVNYV